MYRLALVAALALVSPRRAAADLPSRSYLWDGGAVPFLYLPIAGYLMVRSSWEPRDRPLMFSRREGGAHYDGGQFPTPLLYLDAAVAAALIVAGGDESRWFHLKGFAQGVAMTQFLTVVAKSAFGRHRPSYDLDDGAANTPDQHKSFWSGHASATLATATYLALYARGHIFNRWRAPGTLPWWEGAAYVGLATAALAIPYSQYHLHRHHGSDVIVGSAVGAATATLFYVMQEHRFRGAIVVPQPDIRGVALTGKW